jgi:hypothetical protein
MQHQQPRICSNCFNPKTDASFVLVVEGVKHRVHKFCGEQLMAAAPEGASVRLVKASDLAREEREAREAAESARVQSFWADKFSQASHRRKPNGLAAESSPQPSG